MAACHFVYRAANHGGSFSFTEKALHDSWGISGAA